MEGAFKDRPVEMPERFGEIYFAPLGKFAEGAEHFGMVCRRKKGPEWRGVMRFSPITSQKQTGKRARLDLFMPKDTQLCRETANKRLSKDSWMLLHLGPIPVRRETLREAMEKHHAHHVGWLPEQWVARVHAKLEGSAPE